MSTANNNGWDFVKVGETYQYKEGSFIAMISIIEDNSDDENYRFTIKILEATRKPRSMVCDIFSQKLLSFGYPGMCKIFKKIMYNFEYKWKNPTIAF